MLYVSGRATLCTYFGVKYLSTPITCIEIHRDYFNLRLEMKIESLLLTSSGKLFHSLIEDGKNEWKY